MMWRIIIVSVSPNLLIGQSNDDFALLFLKNKTFLNCFHQLITQFWKLSSHFAFSPAPDIELNSKSKKRIFDFEPKKMDESNDMERKQKFEQNVKDYLEAMDKIQHNLVKILEESMKLNETLQEAISQRAEQYLEHNNQRIPRGKGQ